MIYIFCDVWYLWFKLHLMLPYKLFLFWKKKKKIQKLQVIFLGQYKASHFQYPLKKFLLASQLSSLIFLSEFPITNLHLPHPNCNFFIGHIHIKVPKRIKTNMFQQSWRWYLLFRQEKKNHWIIIWTNR